MVASPATQYEDGPSDEKLPRRPDLSKDRILVTSGASLKYASRGLFIQVENSTPAWAFTINADVSQDPYPYEEGLGVALVTEIGTVEELVASYREKLIRAANILLRIDKEHDPGEDMFTRDTWGSNERLQTQLAAAGVDSLTEASAKKFPSIVSRWNEHLDRAEELQSFRQSRKLRRTLTGIKHGINTMSDESIRKEIETCGGLAAAFRIWEEDRNRVLKAALMAQEAKKNEGPDTVPSRRPAPEDGVPALGCGKGE